MAAARRGQMIEMPVLWQCQPPRLIGRQPSVVRWHRDQRIRSKARYPLTHSHFY